MSDSKGYWQLYESSVVLELTFASATAANTDTNINSATLETVRSKEKTRPIPADAPGAGLSPAFLPNK
jgi:hypothetical protein